MALMKYDLDTDWRFTEGLPDGAESIDFDDSQWEKVDLPHDWGIEGEFNPDAPSYCRGAWLPAGKGVYRKRLILPEDIEDKRISVYFGGAYRNARVFCNGRPVAFRPWGYISFECDLTDYIKPGEANVLAVFLDNSSQPGSRWYTGSGLYRGVSLYIRDSIHVPTWGTQVTTSDVSADSAVVRIKTKLKNHSSRRTEITAVTSILDERKQEVAGFEKTHVIGAGLLVCVEDSAVLERPDLWDTEHPSLYTLRQELFRDGRRIDSVETSFGIRDFQCDADKGLSLNGRSVKVKGVCLHNDGGALGAACGRLTFERQLKTLKDMGCNAVRTAHHPFSEEFLDVCDELGLLVLAEAFDEWQDPINVGPRSDGEPQMTNVDYYARLFDEWSTRDLMDMILRDRNHPSIFMWSIGNEIPQMHKATGRGIAERLCETVHNLDARPVTCAVTMDWCEFTDRNVEALDVAGYNYPRGSFLDEQKRKFPERIMMITEHASAQFLVPRGTYFSKGAGPELPYRHPSALKTVRASETMQHGIEAWEITESRPFVMGCFIWTGWDYLGEITPYDWPAHTSFFGIIDTCGFPKDGYYYYRSRWRSEPLVHLRTHWNWPKGTTVAVRAISNCPSVSLFLNDREIGVRQAEDGFTWDIGFEPGELKAVGMMEGKSAAEYVIRTSGDPHRLRLTEYGESRLAYSFGDLAYITCEVLDSDDIPVPLADNRIRFEIQGPARLRALDNGDPFDAIPFQGVAERRAFHGKCLALVEFEKEGGKIAVTARTDGLLPGEIMIRRGKDRRA